MTSLERINNTLMGTGVNFDDEEKFVSSLSTCCGTLGDFMNLMKVMIGNGASDSLILRVIEELKSLQIKIKAGDMKNFFDALREPKSDIRQNGVYFREAEDSVESNTSPSIRVPLQQEGSMIPMRFHQTILDALIFRLKGDDPSHIMFSGQKDSFLSIPNIKISCPKEYTVAMWINVSFDSPAKGFLLYRSRSVAGGVDVILSNRQADMITWEITLRSHIGKQVTKKAELTEEIVGLRARLEPNTWHLVTVHHVNCSNYAQKDYVTVAIDGKSVSHVEDISNGRYRSNSQEEEQAKQQLLYPFRGLHTVESQWVFALGLKGLVYNICLYSGEMTNDQVRMLYCLGRYTSNLSRGVGVPQTSFDTAYLVLGTQYTKGPSARGACQCKPEFCITSDAFPSRENTQFVDNHPQSNCGRASVDQIIMNPYGPELTSSIILNGDSAVQRGYSWTEGCISESCITLCLYLLWNYCNKGKNQAFVQDKEILRQQSGRITSVLNLIIQLIENSIEFKENFVQFHGFHVISFCLMTLETQLRSAVIGVDMVDCVTRMVRALGDDAIYGDGIASALQGLILNFCVWGGNEIGLDTRLHLVEALCVMINDATDALYRYVGTQRVLDILRLNILRVADDSNDPILKQCANAGDLLLQNVLDSALRYAIADSEELKRGIPATTLPPSLVIRKNYPGLSEIEMLLACLEETSSSFLVDIVLNTLVDLRDRIPNTILHCFSTNRFADAVVPALLCKRGLSTKTRKLTLILLLWYHVNELRRVPSELVKLRIYTRRVLGDGTYIPNKGQFRQIHGPPGEDADEDTKLLWMRHELMLPVVHVWHQLHLLAQCIDKSMNDGCWLFDEAYEDLLSVVIHDGSTSSVKVWLILPLLKVFFSNNRASISSVQRVLMGINIMTKTDLAQSEVLGAIPDQMWIEHFLELVLAAEKVIEENQSDKNTKELASTCIDLALDGLGTVIEAKTRFYCEESFETWRVLQGLLARPQMKANELSYLKRCLSIVVQRVSRRGDAWNAYNISGVVNVIHLVENRNLCGNISMNSSSTVGDSQEKTGSLLIDLEDSANVSSDGLRTSRSMLLQSQDERQIMCFVMDIMASLRKQAEHGALHGFEQYALRPALRVILGCLRFAEGDAADRLVAEVINELVYMSEPWGARSADDFKKFFLRVITQVRATLEDSNIGEHERGRYQALIYSMMHHFLDLRQTLADGIDVSVHILPTLDLMIGIDTCKDIKNIFALIDVNFTAIDTISFDENRSNLLETVESTIADIWNVEQPTLPSPPPETQEIDLLGDAYAEPTAEADQAEAQLMAGRSAQAWYSLRMGILADRVDTERTRLARSLHAIDSTIDATRKYWEKMCSKLESEVFAVRHKCEWKMGVSHEGSFPSRKRLVLRPRRLDNRNAQARARSASSQPVSPVHNDEKSVTELGKAMKSYIREVTAEEGKSLSQDKNGNGDSELSPEVTDEPGSGWSVVDADDSNEGFGVVGVVEKSNLISNSKSADKEDGKDQSTGSTGDVDTTEEPMVMDVNGDTFEMDEALTHGRIAETGPAHTGSRRFGSGNSLHEAKVILITASGNVHGNLSFNKKEIFFASTQESGDLEEGKQDKGTINLSKRSIRRRRWVLSAVSALYLRRFRLRDSALEVFFRRGKHRNFFVDFGHEEKDWRARDEFVKLLIKAIPTTRYTPFLQYPSLGDSALALVRQHGVQERWLSGNMSNFDYLMALNTIAGRSFNDLCQYPVMPWVIAQYTESSIDLSDPRTYRDLSRPMGAINEDRLEDLLERFSTMQEEYEFGAESIPPFMYGSHYSTMVGVVLHFLVRLQPFASLHSEMQGGHFDVADRIFSSIPRTWRQNTTQLSEVKEITPEWFTTPEIFKNVNRFEFGTTQDGELVDDVQLPPWAKTAEEFVRINREALESKYVSEHLHEWIDLIFGYKQTGEAAVEANNVFFYLTYYNAIDRSRIDEDLRRQIELQISHFGQTPMQLFSSPHPAKKVNKLQSSYLTASDKNLTRSFRRNFAENCAAINSPLRNYQSEQLTVNSSLMTTPANVEEAASRNTKATQIFTPARTGASFSSAICIFIMQTRISCVLSNGVIEVMHFASTKNAKQCVMKEQNELQKRNKRSKSTGIPAPIEPEEAIISFDEDFSAAVPVSPISDRGAQNGDETDFVLPTLLLALEPDRAHFESLPRLLLAEATPPLEAARIVKRVHSGGYVLVGGFNDGRVAVREVDQSTGYLKSSGDFLGHRSRVVSFASDSIVDADTDVIASCDANGHMFVWTVSRVDGTTPRMGHRSTISRRPQRSFCFPINGDSIPSCEIVWQMGVVLVASINVLYIFSVERDELLKSLNVNLDDNHRAKSKEENGAHADQQEHAGQGKHDVNSTEDLLSFSAEMNAEGGTPPTTAAGTTRIRQVVACSHGSFILHLDYLVANQPTENYIAAYSIGGSLIRLVYSPSAVTFLSCPSHGEVVISGHADGSVYLYDASSLATLYALCPRTFSFPGFDEVQQQRVNDTNSGNPGKNAVVKVEAGPDPLCPVILAISTADGALYVKTLADYMQWDRIRSPSVVSQVVNAPMKAMRSAIQNASTLSSSVADNAGIFAHNMRGFADDAIGKLTGGGNLKSLGEDLGNNSIVKGFSSFFGSKKS